MSNIVEYAEKEFDILSESHKNSEDRPIIEPFKKEILALVDAFARSGQSGASAPFTASAIARAIKHLCLLEPIMPITGKDDEWIKISDDKYQNNRLSSLFRKGKKSYYLNAIVWQTQRGTTWSGQANLNGKAYSGRQYVKKFPFIPKTFVIKVNEMELGHGNWDLQIIDPAELDKVFEYYNEYPVDAK